MPEERPQKQLLWKRDILTDTKFQSLSIEDKQKVATKYFNDFILTDPTYQASDDSTKKTIQDNFINTIQPQTMQDRIDVKVQTLEQELTEPPERKVSLISPKGALGAAATGREIVEPEILKEVRGKPLLEGLRPGIAPFIEAPFKEEKLPIPLPRQTLLGAKVSIPKREVGVEKLKPVDEAVLGVQESLLSLGIDMTAPETLGIIGGAVLTKGTVVSRLITGLMSLFVIKEIPREVIEAADAIEDKDISVREKAKQVTDAVITTLFALELVSATVKPFTKGAKRRVLETEIQAAKRKARELGVTRLDPGTVGEIPKGLRGEKFKTLKQFEKEMLELPEGATPKSTVQLKRELKTQGILADPQKITPIKLIDDPIAAGAEFLRQAKPRITETEILRTAEKGKRFAKGADILRTGFGSEAAIRSLAAQKGKLPEAQIKFAKEVPSELINGMHETARQSFIKGEISFGESLTLNNAIFEVFGFGKGELAGKPRLPQRNEILLFERVFGSKFAKEMLKFLPRGNQKWQTFLEIMNIPRALLASYDLSFSFRQGGMVLSANPKIWARAFGAQLKALASKKNYLLIDKAIKADPLFKTREDMGVFRAPVTELERALTPAKGKVEPFVGAPELKRLSEKARLNKIPGIRQALKGVELSERAYITMGNKLRADLANNYIKKLQSQGFEINKSVTIDGKHFTRQQVNRKYELIANLVNSMTGRGTIKVGEDLAPALNILFFSPRFFASRGEVIAKLFSKDPLVRKIAWTNVGATLATTTAILTTLATQIPNATVEKDPRSSDFMKLKIGNTRVDPWAGYQPLFRFTWQMLAQQERKTLTSKRIRPIKRSELIGKFFRGKASPQFGAFIDWMAGETAIGKKFAANRELRERMIPISIQDFFETWNFQSPDMAIATTAPNFLGIGTQTFEETPFNKVFNLKKQKAFEAFGEKWENLSPLTQDALRKANPGIEQLEAEGKFLQEKGVDLNRIRDEGEQAGLNVFNQLDTKIQSKLNDALVAGIGLVPRSIGGFGLNDERFRERQDFLAAELNEKLQITLAPNWDNLPERHKRTLLRRIIENAKKKSTQFIKTKAEVETIKKIKGK